MEIGNQSIETMRMLAEHPEQVDVSQADWLLKIAEQFPYFAAPQILLAKLYHKEGRPDYDKKLGKAALQIADRKQLYHLLFQENLAAKVARFETEVAEQVEDVECEMPKEEEGLVVEAQQAVLNPPIRHIPELEKEILYEAISSSIEQEVGQEVGVQDDEDDAEMETEELANPEVVDVQPVVASSYGAWLSKRAAEIHWDGRPDTSSSESEVRKDTRRDITAVEDVPAPQKDVSSLIDRFIKNDPKITPGRAEFFTNENLAKLSLVEDDSFVTESLAKIYARQGKLEKARKAYRLLSLKYPEKSVYFAAQIKKLGKSNP